MGTSVTSPGVVDLAKIGDDDNWHIVKADGYGVLCGRNGGSSDLERGVDERVSQLRGVKVCADCRRIHNTNPPKEEPEMTTTTRKKRGEGLMAGLKPGSLEQRIYTLGNQISGATTRLKRTTDTAKKAEITKSIETMKAERTSLRAEAKAAKATAAPAAAPAAPPEAATEAAASTEAAAPAATAAKPDPKPTPTPKRDPKRRSAKKTVAARKSTSRSR